MPEENVDDHAKTMRTRVSELKARLHEVMQERGKIEAALEEAAKTTQRLQQNSSALDAEEGKIRKQLGDLKNSLAALGESSADLL
jgi:chaperonin cofactor prefoldin